MAHEKSQQTIRKASFQHRNRSWASRCTFLTNSNKPVKQPGSEQVGSQPARQPAIQKVSQWSSKPARYPVIILTNEAVNQSACKPTNASPLRASHAASQPTSKPTNQWMGMPDRWTTKCSINMLSIHRIRRFNTVNPLVNLMHPNDRLISIRRRYKQTTDQIAKQPRKQTIYYRTV